MFNFSSLEIFLINLHYLNLKMYDLCELHIECATKYICGVMCFKLLIFIICKNEFYYDLLFKLETIKTASIFIINFDLLFINVVYYLMYYLVCIFIYYKIIDY